MLDSVLETFGIGVDYDLNIMRPNQSLNDVLCGVVAGLDAVLRDVEPDYVLVQGDTASCMAASLAAFFRNVKVGHIEAGLRTGDIRSPWPEEANRRVTAVVANRHYAPTEKARNALLAEGHAGSSVLVTGNTVIDALQYMVARISEPGPVKVSLEAEFGWLDPSKRMILVTGHRRESFGDGFRSICGALRELAGREDVQIVYPVHLNPNVQGPVNEILGGLARVHLIPPQDYERFIYLMTRCSFILTDSGGIQEEAPFIRKPVLVMRDTSERMEAIDAGVARLVSTDKASILRYAFELLDDPLRYAGMANGASPFGDGRAAHRILEDLVS